MKRISTAAAGAVVLSGLIGLTSCSRKASTRDELAVASAPVSAEPETHEMPPNVVTMLGVPEVILTEGPAQATETQEPSVPAAARVHAVNPVPAPNPVTHETVRRAPTSNSSLAKILAGQAPPPPTTHKASSPTPRH